MTLRRLSALALAATLSGAALGADAGDPFPCPGGLREGVEFWKKVWAGWTMNQVVLHDMEHPAIVYEVFELPGPVEETYTDAQRDYVKARREALSARLLDVEGKVDAGQDLADDEKALVLKITEVAGSGGLAGASERVRSQRGLRERFRRGLELAGRYHDAFTAIFREAGLPEDLAYLPHVESSYQVQARSSAGAIGVWQFTRGAARKFMQLNAAVDERRDPVAAARGAARYLKAAFEDLGSWPLAITSYNHGIEGMRAAHERFGDDFEKIVAEYDGRTFGFASKSFYLEFLAAREIATNPGAFYTETLTPDPPLALDEVSLEAPTAASHLASRYGLSVEKLAALNPAWTARAISGRAALPAGTRVWLPEGTLAKKAPKPSPKPQPADEEHSVHVVRRGETLFRIATSYGVPLARLLDANGLEKSATIHPGQELRIPSAR